MSRYFTVYAAILGILALLLFLSPQISKLISADTNEGIQILKNVDFETQEFDDRVWATRLGNPQNTLQVSEGKLIIQNALSKDNYSMITQRLQLSKQKIYKLQLDYDWQNNKTSSDIASIGILKKGINSGLSLSFEIPRTDSKLVKFFTVNDSFADPYLYLLIQGSGSFSFNEISLFEFDQLPEGSKLEDSSKSRLLPIRISGADGPLLTNGSSPQASETPVIGASPIAVNTTTSTALPAITKSTVAAQLAQVNENRIEVYPGWNVISLNMGIDSSLFTNENLISFQMFGSKWLKADATLPKISFSKTGAIYLYNGTEKTKTIAISPSSHPSKASISKGWNLLANSTANELKNDSEFELSGKKTKLAELIRDKKASSEIYTLTTGKTGVTMKKIDLFKESIPANSAFWIYFLN